MIRIRTVERGEPRPANRGHECNFASSSLLNLRHAFCPCSARLSSGRPGGRTDRMKIFHCGHCDQLVFFENTRCVNCGHTLAYLPDRTDVGALEPDGGRPLAVALGGRGGREYRLCPNYSEAERLQLGGPRRRPEPVLPVVPADPDHPRPEPARHPRGAGRALEAAKRRLIYSLLCLDLPIATQGRGPRRAAWPSSSSPTPTDPGAPPVLTGHDDGRDHDQRRRGRRRRARAAPARSCTSRTAPSSATSATRSAITTGTA